MKKLIIFLSTMFFSVNTAFAGVGWTGERTILELETVPSGIEIRLAGSNGACGVVTEGGVQKTWVKIFSSQENMAQYLSTVLTAFSKGHMIDIYCNTSDAWPGVAHIKYRAQ